MKTGFGITRFVLLSIWAAILFLSASGGALAANSFDFEVVSVRAAPGAPNQRPHLVSAGKTTTFVLRTKNTGTAPVNVSVTCGEIGKQKWHISFQESDSLFRPVGAPGKNMRFHLERDREKIFLAKMTPEASCPEGEEALAVIRAASNGVIKQVSVKAKVHNAPKLYIVAIDALGAGYLSLDKYGNRGSTTRLLMPNLVTFCRQNAYSQNASCLLPSATDMNHTAALTGCWPGTSGIPYVLKYYIGMGVDAKSRFKPLWTGPNHVFLKYGLEGTPVETVFDLAKADDPDAFTAYIAGKQWTGKLFDDGAGSLDLFAKTVDLRALTTPRPPYPHYLPPLPEPAPLVFADPPSDDNPEDLDGNNDGEDNTLLHSVLNPESDPGLKPALMPPDRWVTEGALRILAAEDPDVLFILPAACDDVQHIYGAADRPEEWTEGNTPVLWDDINEFNKGANREATLDIVHEADACFGLIIDALRARRAYEDSVVVCYADHSQVTLLPETESLDLKTVLREFYVTYPLFPRRFIDAYSSSSVCLEIFTNHRDFTDQKFLLGKLEQYLQDYTINYRNTGQPVHPYIVINRAEMDSGIDDIIGPFANGGGGAFDKRGELYSAWCIDKAAPEPVDPMNPEKARWPDLLLFTTARIPAPLDDAKPIPLPGVHYYIGGHGNLDTTIVPLALHSPGLVPIELDTPGTEQPTLADITPTICRAMGWTIPETVFNQFDGRVLDEIFQNPNLLQKQ